MANFPTSLPVLTNVSSAGGDKQDGTGPAAKLHDALHNECNDEVEAIAASLGIGPAAGVGDYLFNAWHAYTGLAWIGATNTSVATPFWVPETQNFDALAVEVSQLDAAGVAQFHRYALAAGGEPGAKNVNALATVVVTSAGVKICVFAAPVSFAAGWHYLVLENTLGVARYRTDTIVHSRFHPGGNFGSASVQPAKGAYLDSTALTDPWDGAVTPVAAPIALALRRSA